MLIPSQMIEGFVRLLAGTPYRPCFAILGNFEFSLASYARFFGMASGPSHHISLFPPAAFHRRISHRFTYAYASLCAWSNKVRRTHILLGLSNEILDFRGATPRSYRIGSSG